MYIHTRTYNEFFIYIGSFDTTWGNATPTELLRVRTACYGITIHCSRERAIHIGITIHYSRERTIHLGLTTHGRWERTIYDALLITNALINMEHDEGG